MPRPQNPPPRPDYVHCVTTAGLHEEPARAYCDGRIIQHEWRFIDLEHAIRSKDCYVQPCIRCLRTAAKFLIKVSKEVSNQPFPEEKDDE